ncbi:MAG: hypothetical protein Kow0092_17800 [Deferrisomatales bacterium]
MLPGQRPPTTGGIVRFWTPLAATWLMMAAEGPFLAAVIARLPEPTFNLAAYGVSLSLALILEAPIIMLMGAAAALVKGRESFLALRRFTRGLNALVTLGALLVLLPPVFRWLAGPVLDLPPEVAWRTYGAVGLFLPWPAAIGYRRLYQGVLICRGLTRRVGYGTAVRVGAVGATALALYRWGAEGAYVGAASLSVGVVAEAVACRVMVRGARREVLAAEDPPGTPRWTAGALSAFYFPLALSSILGLAVHPLVTFFVTRAPASVESLAVLPVIRSLVFLFSCLGLSYQEVGIALLGDDEGGYRALRRFAWFLGLGTAVGLAGISLSPLARIWFHTVSGLSEELTRFALGPTRLLSLFPALTVFVSFLRALHVHRRETRPITWATVLEVGGIGAALFAAIRWAGLPGALAAAAALLAGRTLSAAYLLALARLRPRPAAAEPVDRSTPASVP